MLSSNLGFKYLSVSQLCRLALTVGKPSTQRFTLPRKALCGNIGDEGPAGVVIMRKDRRCTKISAFLYLKYENVFSFDNSQYFPFILLRVTLGSEAFVAVPMYREYPSTLFSRRYGS
jgi:hypothetical protein